MSGHLLWLLFGSLIAFSAAQCIPLPVPDEIVPHRPAAGIWYHYREPYVVIPDNMTLQIDSPLITGSALRIAREEAELDVRHRGPTKIYFLHIHKAGGSNLCRVATAGGISVPPGTNCNPKYGDYREGGRDWFPLGCLNSTQLLNWAHIAPWSFFANEFYPMHNFPPPGAGKFAYVAVLRNPLDRVLSHYNHERFYNLNIWNRWPTFSEFVNDPKKWRSFMDFGGVSEPEYYPEPFGFSNYMTYMLTGCVKCTQVHLELAKSRLHYFSALILRERYEETYYVMASRLGWPYPFPSDRVEIEGRRNSNATMVLEPTPEALATLIAANQLDLELYAYASDLVDSWLQELPPIPPKDENLNPDRAFYVDMKSTPPPPGGSTPPAAPVPPPKESVPDPRW